MLYEIKIGEIVKSRANLFISDAGVTLIILESEEYPGELLAIEIKHKEFFKIQIHLVRLIFDLIKNLNNF